MGSCIWTTEAARVKKHTVFPRSDAAATINFPLLALAATIRGRRLLEGGVNYTLPRAYILLRRRGHATPIVTVQTSKFFSVTKNSNIAQVRTRACQCCL